MILENSYFEGWLEGQQCPFPWWESMAFQGKISVFLTEVCGNIRTGRFLLTLTVWEAPLLRYFMEIWLPTGVQFLNICLSFMTGRLWGCQTLRKLLFACCHCHLKGLGNGNIGGDLLRKTCNTCNLAAFLPDSQPQQWTTVSRCSHELRPVENFSPSCISVVHVPGATKPICFLSKSQQDKAVPSSRWQEDDGERARKAPWSWILAICVTRGYQPSLQAVRPNLQEKIHIWATRHKLRQTQQK